MSENPYQLPSAELIDKNMQPSFLDHFDRFSTGYVFGLNMVIFGVYTIYWLYSRTRKLNRMNNNRSGFHDFCWHHPGHLYGLTLNRYSELVRSFYGDQL